jgi:hypothetical protein
MVQERYVDVDLGLMKEGMVIPGVEIPKRQNRYLKEKEIVEMKRMKKKGLL